MSSTDCKNLAPIWETVATDYASDDNVVIAKVDAENANSKAISEEHKVSSYPTLLWFPAGTKEAVKYEAGRGERDFLQWINEQAGTHRTPGGELNDIAGTVASLDTIVAGLLGGTALAEAAAQVKAEVTKLTNAAQQKYGAYYVRVFDKLVKNEGFVAKELARLNGILAKGGLVPTKRDEIKSKTNVLRKFVEKVAEKVEEIKDEL